MHSAVLSHTLSVILYLMVSMDDSAFSIWACEPTQKQCCGVTPQENENQTEYIIVDVAQRKQIERKSRQTWQTTCGHYCWGSSSQIKVVNAYWEPERDAETNRKKEWIREDTDEKWGSVLPDLPPTPCCSNYQLFWLVLERGRPIREALCRESFTP